MKVIRYAKGRAIILIYSFLLSFLFIDYWKWKYWQFAIWFIPCNFIIGYLINRKVFE